MAARGSEFKAAVMQQIMATFPNSFLTNGGKELRIFTMEDGEEIQIKVALTAAKVNVDHGGDSAFVTPDAPATPAVSKNAPDKEELENVQSMLRRLGIGGTGGI